MKRSLMWLLTVLLFPVYGAQLELKTPTGTFALDPAHGNVSKIADAAGRTVLTGSETRYLVMSTAGDATLFEHDDKVVRSERGKDGSLTLECVNPKLPDFLVTKRYWVENNGLRRTLTFTNKGKVVRYVLPMTDMDFADDFRKNVWHLGAGYIGPYKPLPHVDMERPVNEYRQSSKGMVLINPDEKSGNFSHYRVKINDQVVLPWWHSTIGHYREYADRLYYTPKGYRMGLGTLDVQPGGSISVTDCFHCFDGDMFTFFDDIFAKDREVAAELKSIPPSPAWIGKIWANVPMSVVDYVRYLEEMGSEGILMGLNTPFGSWGDYRVTEKGFPGFQGGRILPEEYLAFLKLYHDVSPRFEHSTYNIVVSTSFTTALFKEHPEWFRPKDRSGSEDSLFPGLQTNYQSMFNNAGLRDFLVDTLIAYADWSKSRVIYLDEAQMTNTIDWQRGQLTRDDHTVAFWKALKKRAAEKGIALFYNGSGHPYADLNYMESPHDMRPDRWRDYVGIAWGLGLMNRMAPGRRMVPLYWSAVTDYVNRILALGWIPAPGVLATNFPIMRAVYQLGNTLPFNVKYTPDWKLDEKLEVESHAVQRQDSRDVMVSFINRAAKAADLPVALRLDTLGFQPAERINLWRIAYRCGTRSTAVFHLSDKEVRANYGKTDWGDGAVVTVPVLVYSGPASGEFNETVKKLATGAMVTYLATAAPASVYSLNDLPQNGFYTVTRHGSVNGKAVELDQPGELLLIDREREFYDVLCDGKKAETSVVDAGGTAGLRVKVAQGRHTLDWKARPKSAAPSAAPAAKVSVNDIVTTDNAVVAVERDGVTVYTGPTPVTLPALRANGDYRVRYPGGSAATKIKLYGGKGTRVPTYTFQFGPERQQVVETAVKHGDVTVTKKAEFTSRYEDVTGMQRDLHPAVAEADPDKLVIVSGTTRREGINLYHAAYAGLELNGARQIKVRLSHTFGAVDAIPRGHLRKGSGKPETNFAGLIVDYRVKGKYVKRVALSVGLYHPKYDRTEPAWGKGGKPDLNLELGDLIEQAPEREFSLDLEKFAPKDWDGTVFLNVGTARILPNRRLKLEILKFNDKSAGDFLSPELPEAAGERVKPADLTSTVLKTKPRSLTGAIDPAEWEKWTKIGKFQPFGFRTDTILRAQTSGFLAHDFEYLYFGFHVQEPTRAAIANFAEPHRNERVEVLIRRPDGKLFQVLADLAGRQAIYINGMQSELEGVIVKAKAVPGKGTDLFVAIPIELLKFDMQRTPVLVKANFCRVRLGSNPEYSVWAPVEKGFAEVARYATLVLHF